MWWSYRFEALDSMGQGQRQEGDMETEQAKTITVEDFEEKVLNADFPVLVDFHRSSCLPCQQLAPTIDNLGEYYRARDTDRIYVYKCEDGQLFEMLKVQFVPQLILFNCGRDHWIDRSIRTVEGLKKEIGEILGRP
jgi:thioredoxin 1